MSAWLRRERNRQFVYDILRQSECVDCGDNRPEVLQFDHQRDKHFDINAGVHNRYGLAKLRAEIEKCEIRCANCHAIRTARMQGWYRRLQ